MRRLILSMMISLDGFTARSDGDLSWFRSDRAFEEEMLALLRSVDAMLFGRVSYELLADYWPTAGTASSGEAPGGFTTREREIEFARLMNSIPKLVFSRTREDVGWGPARVVKGDLAEEITRLKDQPGRDLVLFAGADLASTCMKLDLVDEYRLMVHPIVLGTGVALFRDMEERQLELRRVTPFPSGVVLLRYERHLR